MKRRKGEQLIHNEQVVGSIPMGGSFDEALSHPRQGFFNVVVDEIARSSQLAAVLKNRLVG